MADEWLKDAGIEGTFSWYINHRWDPYSDRDPESSYERFLSCQKKKNKKKFLYLTLSPDKKIRNLNRTETNLHALEEFCEKWFNEDKKYYNAFEWVIESGSKGDHLHIHALCDMKTTHKHAERLKKFWRKYFPNNQLLTTLNLASRYKCLKCSKGGCNNPKHRGEYCYLNIDDDTILQDKVDYFKNSEKGSHMNLIDEGLRGFRGGLTLTKE